VCIDKAYVQTKDHQELATFKEVVLIIIMNNLLMLFCGLSFALKLKNDYDD